MTDFSAVAADYLTTRRAMGYKLPYQGQMVEQFATTRSPPRSAPSTAA
jgi:hypothetical protein